MSGAPTRLRFRPQDPASAERLARELTIPPPAARVLAARGLADPRDASVTTRAACPDDRDLEQPISIGALAAAYAGARACFARQIAAGRSWRDVK